MNYISHKKSKTLSSEISLDIDGEFCCDKLKVAENFQYILHKVASKLIEKRLKCICMILLSWIVILFPLFMKTKIFDSAYYLRKGHL